MNAPLLFKGMDFVETDIVSDAKVSTLSPAKRREYMPSAGGRFVVKRWTHECRVMLKFTVEITPADFDPGRGESHKLLDDSLVHP